MNETDETVDQIQRLVRERNSGKHFFSDLTPLEWELIMVWDDYVDAHERAHKTRVSSLFDMLAGMAQGHK